MHMYGHEYYGGNGIVGAQVSIKYMYIINCSLGSIPRMEPSALLDASLSSYTNFFSVYVYTTYCIEGNCNKFLFFNGIFV